MSRETSPATGRAYGLRRVCEVLGVARSSLYAARERDRAEGTPRESRRRGPVPELDDATLLAKVRADLAASPFVNEGHRPVWARLTLEQKVRTSRKRVLRLMRENSLLSPHRRPRGDAKAHEGTIVTDAPDKMWATDGATVETVSEGKVWVFVAVDHFHGECVGFHVAKHGTRFAALQPLAMGLSAHRGGACSDAGRGIEVRQDHGSQYTSDTYRNQVKAWGMSLSFALVGEPETNGVAERFIRTLKEQVVHGHAYAGVDALREAVRRFVETYNRAWRLAKLGFKTPLEARAAASLPTAA